METEKEDLFLVNECLGGNGRSFDIIVERYYKVIYRLAVKFVRSYDDAEEITQRVFVKAYENLKSYNPKYKFFSWLYRITINEAINFGKRKKNSEELDEDLRSDDREPVSQTEANEQSDNILNALMELDMLYRIPIVLKHFMDYSYKELSDLLGIPEKTVKSRLFTGRQLLKDILIKYRVYKHD